MSCVGSSCIVLEVAVDTLAEAVAPKIQQVLMELVEAVVPTIQELIRTIQLEPTQDMEK